MIRRPSRAAKRQSGSAGVRAVLLTVIAVSIVVAATHVPDLGAAIVRAVGSAPVTSSRSTPAVPAIAKQAPEASRPANPAVQAPIPAGGTCVSLPAHGNPSGQTVFVDAGHGGPDPGAIGHAGATPVMEKAVTLEVAKLLAPLLQNDGYRVVMARTNDSSVDASQPSNGGLSADDIRRDLLARIDCANRSGANLLVSIHFNALSDPGVAGSESFYDALRPFAASNHRLALDLERSITTTLGSTNLGVWPDDENVGPALTPAGAAYGHLIELGPPSPGYVDHPSQMPGALVEPLFLSNSVNAQEASDPNAQQLIALAIDRGIRSYFSGA